MQLAPDAPSTEPLPARLPKGFALGEHVLDGWLRDGGMAAIYRAHRSSDDRRVAVKLQLPSTAHDPVVCQRFDREVELMRRARGSEQVIELFDAGVLDDGRRYLVMEWVEGEDLEELLDFLRNQDQRLSVLRACRIARDAATGLAELHALAVVHLDLKPANVMIGRDLDGSDVVKLVDFGIAADLREEKALGDGTAVMGTSSYMSPQQALGDPPEPSFDLYALGVLLYELLSGTRVPPDGWTPDTLPRVETRRRGVPPALGELVRGCMDFEPARRPKTATDVVAVLAEVIDELLSLAARQDLSSQEMPARTGGTEIIPLASVSSIADATRVRTGGTEATITHEEVMLSSGLAPPALQEAVSQAKQRLEATLAEQAVRRRRRWIKWAMLGGVLALGGIRAWLWIGDDDADGSEQAPTPAGVEAHEPSSTNAIASQSSTPEIVMTDDAAAPDGKVDEPSLVAHADPTAATTPIEPNSELGSTGSSHQKRIPKSPSGPSKEACDAMRAEAESARKARAWTKVLQATTQRSCWTSGQHRLSRTRLRVAAYAEQGDYEKCATEGSKSMDRDIVTRTDFCKKKLAGDERKDEP